jgi:hypothetical protein
LLLLLAAGAAATGRLCDKGCGNGSDDI